MTFEDSTTAMVTVVVPVRNENRRIVDCLESILANDYPPRAYEVLVVDGASTDGSRQKIEQLASRYAQLRLLDNPQRTVPAALNMAIRQAAGMYILRMDAHCEYPRDYIRSCVTELERTGAANVGGCMHTLAGGSSWTARAIAALTQHPVGVGNSSFRTGRSDAFVDTVPFGAFRRDVFERVGLFREDLVRNQDFEMNARIRAAGMAIYLSPKISLRYYNSCGVRPFVKQAISNGIWCARCWIRYPVSFCWRHAAPMALVSTLAGASLLGCFFESFRIASAVFAGLYLTALLTMGVQLAWRHNWRYLLLAPLLTGTYHACYGAATLVGLGSSLASFQGRRPPHHSANR